MPQDTCGQASSSNQASPQKAHQGSKRWLLATSILHTALIFCNDQSPWLMPLDLLNNRSLRASDPQGLLDERQTSTLRTSPCSYCCHLSSGELRNDSVASRSARRIIAHSKTTPIKGFGLYAHLFNGLDLPSQELNQFPPCVIMQLLSNKLSLGSQVCSDHCR